MSLTDTPDASRLHIAFFNRRNSGKSSLINVLTGQDTALVSDTPEVVTDLVSEAMEIQGIGPCLFIDTSGFDDEEELGELRISWISKTIEKADTVLLLCGDTISSHEKEVLALSKERNIPVIPVLNKVGIRENSDGLVTYIEEECKIHPLLISAKEKIGIGQIRQVILKKLPPDSGQQSITEELVTENDLVLLVMLQDIQAPRDRLILPQVQTIRELLDKRYFVVICTTDKFLATLQALAHPLGLIIIDSQALKATYGQKPKESGLVSFSVLFAGYKGDVHYYTESVATIERLTESSYVLIAGAYTYASPSENIGRVKLPRLLRKRIGENLQIGMVVGADSPQDLTPCSSVIHCGACMFNRKYVLSRIERAREQRIPMTNYEVAIAFLNGILDQVKHQKRSRFSLNFKMNPQNLLSDFGGSLRLYVKATSLYGEF